MEIEGREGLAQRLYTHEGSTFVVAVNHEEAPLKAVQFKINSTQRSDAFRKDGKVWFEDRTVRQSTGTWLDSFAPYGVHIYELSER